MLAQAMHTIEQRSSVTDTLAHTGIGAGRMERGVKTCIRLSQSARFLWTGFFGLVEDATFVAQFTFRAGARHMHLNAPPYLATSLVSIPMRWRQHMPATGDPYITSAAATIPLS